MKSRYQKLLNWLRPHFPLLARAARRAGRIAHRAGKLLAYAAAALLAITALLFGAAHLYLKTIPEHKAEVEKFLSRKSAHDIRITRIEADWEFLNPGVRIDGIGVYAKDAIVPSLQLPQLRISLSVLPLVWGELRIGRLEVVGAQLALERLADGRYRVGGFGVLDPSAGVQDEGFLHWLFRQERLVLRDAELAWRDAREPEAQLHLTGVTLQLRNDGDRHRVALEANFPPALCEACAFSADITGNPFLGGIWAGDARLRARGLDLARLPQVVREQLPAGLRGRFDIELESDWKKSLPRQVSGTAQVTELSLPMPGWPAPLAVREARASLIWRARKEGWELDLRRLTIGLREKPWEAGDLHFRHEPGGQRLEVSRVNLDDVTAFVAGLPPATGKPMEDDEFARLHQLADSWRALAPGGTLHELRVNVSGDGKHDFEVESGVTDLHMRAHASIPGVSNVSGRFAIEPDRGEFLLHANGFRIQLPAYFSEPLGARRAEAHLSWKRNDDHWVVSAREMVIESEDARGRGELDLRLPHDPAQSPHLRLSVDFEDGNIARAAHYYPLPLLSPATRAWLDYAFVSGRIESGSLLYDGDIRAYPFRWGGGKFEIRGRVSDGVYTYLQGWAPLTAVRADVLVSNDSVLVTGRARIGAMQADNISVYAERIADQDASVRVGARIAGPLAETLRVLREVRDSEGESWKAYLAPWDSARGDGVLHLGLDIPLSPEPNRLRGEYRTTGAALRLIGPGLPVEAIAARVEFDEHGLRAGEARAKLFGGEAQARLRGADKNDLAFEVSGMAHGEAIAQLLGPAYAGKFSGTAAWRGDYRLRAEVPAIEAELDLPGFRSTLPAPLYLPDGLTREKLVVRTARATAASHEISFSAGTAVAGRLILARAPAGWRFERGAILLGGASGTLPSDGLAVEARVTALDVDDWLPYRGRAEGALPSVLTRIGAEVADLGVAGRSFGAVGFEMERKQGRWSGMVSGASAEGRVSIRDEGASTRIDLDFARLAVPPRRDRTAASTLDTETDPRRLPHIEARIQDFFWKERSLGTVELSAAPTDYGWHIERLAVTRADGRFTTNGDWRKSGEAQSSDFVFELKSSDTGKMLEALGLPDQIAGGELEVRGALSWPASPAGVRPATLTGHVDISAKKGRILQLKEGAGRFFGVLDLSSLGRYLLLDFSPIFGEGFAYEQVTGKVALEHGDARTHDFSIKGVTAKIGVNGRIGLAAEDFDLVISVDPQLSDTLTLTSWGIWGPQVAAAVLAFQKVFKKQLVEGARMTYVVKGPWKEPSFTKLSVPEKKQEPVAPGG